jgi:hypothetical protein
MFLKICQYALKHPCPKKLCNMVGITYFYMVGITYFYIKR